MTDRELMQQALDALESECDATKFGASEALRARLAQPDLSQVGEVGVWGERQWQGLTDEQVKQIEMSASSTLSAIYLAEAQLKGKNT